MPPKAFLAWQPLRGGTKVTRPRRACIYCIRVHHAILKHHLLLATKLEFVSLGFTALDFSRQGSCRRKARGSAWRACHQQLSRQCSGTRKGCVEHTTRLCTSKCPTPVKSRTRDAARASPCRSSLACVVETPCAIASTRGRGMTHCSIHEKTNAAEAQLCLGSRTQCTQRTACM